MHTVLVAFGCGKHTLYGTDEEIRREYEKIAAIRERLEGEGRFDAIRSVERRDEENRRLGISAAWFECMELVWEEYLRQKDPA